MLENPIQSVPAAEVAGKTLVEEFMALSYEFRRNVLSDKYEMREVCNDSEASQADGRPTDANPKPWRGVTRESQNTIIRRAKRELGAVKDLKASIDEYIHSEETPDYDPIAEYLNQLPAWDGFDHIRELFLRLPGVTEEQIAQHSVWLRSCVAHWLQLDDLHGNEQVLTLIGAQGCGKSTFCAQLLPPQFREYYLDHVNLGNKFDKEMALTSNLLVNLDELDQIKSGKQAELKQMLSKIQVNGRPIFGKAQRSRKRYASFVATTNNPRPLQDTTGSRRYLCVEIPQDTIILNDHPIDYDQLYAQVIYEIRKQNLPYWFTPAETRRIEEMNVKFQRVSDLESMLTTCFRRPEAGEMVIPMLTRDVVRILAKNFPEVKQTQGMNVKVGRLLKNLNYEQKDLMQGSAYFIVPVKSAA